MKSIQEAGPGEVQAIKRRTIRSLAMGDINQSDCDYINQHLDAVTKKLEVINNRTER